VGGVKKPLPRSPLDDFPQIFTIRDQRVLLDETLAELYGVSTRAFNQAVSRNRERFPPDFLLEIGVEEWEILKSQVVTSRAEHAGDRKNPPLAFTGHGSIMAATILNSPRAVQMSVYLVRAFVKAHDLLSSHADVAREPAVPRKPVATVDAETRRQFYVVYEAILGLMSSADRRQ
jgi:hypothetical protein